MTFLEPWTLVGVTFGDPTFLLALLALVAVALWRRGRRPAAVDGGSVRVLGRLPRSLRTRTTWLPGLVLALAATLVVIALARPLKGREEARVITEGIDIQLVVDISSSMLEAHMGERDQTNLDVVKEVVAEFVAGREDDRIGLVSFAAFPRTECPLTLDQAAVLGFLRDLRCVRPNGPEDGTAIGVALGHAARKLMDSDAKSKVIVLLTDGEENVFEIDPAQAAALCRDLGVRVYTVGAGTRIVRDEFFGRTIEVPLRTQLLEDIAASTGGRFFRAKDRDGLSRVYEEIDQLEKTERTDVRYTDYDDLYPLVLMPAALLLLLELLLRRGPYLELAA